MKKLFTLFLFLSVTGITLSAQAQVYRWVDEEGKVHYGDRPPRDNKNVENISKQVNSVNVDTSTSEQKKMSRIFAKETMEEKHARQVEQVNQADRQQQICQQAQKQLEIVRDSAFYYVDAQGNERDLSKEETQQEVARLTDIVNQNCQ